MEKTVAKMTAEFRRLEDMVAKMERMARPKSYARNRNTGIVHRVLCGFDELGTGALTCCGRGTAIAKSVWKLTRPRSGISLVIPVFRRCGHRSLSRRRS